VLLAMAVYGTARHYSLPLVAYVVEQALLQRTPAGVDPVSVRSRFDAFVAASPDRETRLERLFALSRYLEKVQVLSPQDLDSLFGKDSAPFRQERY
jgi:hypothetical protein